MKCWSWKRNRWVFWCCLGAVIVSGLLGTTTTRAEEEVKLNEAEQKFVKLLNKSVLEGEFNIETQGKHGTAKKDRYTLLEVKKAKDDVWLFKARIQYGEKDLTVPIYLPVRWAGDTPVICLDNIMIPGLGTFSGRVLFHGERYVGTWQHDAVGGSMWGNVRPATDADFSSN